MTKHAEVIEYPPIPVGVVVNDEQLRVSVGPTVQNVLSDWTAAHRVELIELLRPYNITPDEIFLPNWERIVRPSEVTGQA
jgi:hypothetical protein